MYLNTLKVSTIEQSADSVSARGGHGNPELIAWDFGKEITVNLEDALYTPASQSLMWGGKFSVKKTKIYGVWNPYIYPVDRYGKQIYAIRTVIEDAAAYDTGNWTINVFIDGQSYHFVVPLGTGNMIEKVSDEEIPIPEYAVGHDYVWFTAIDGEDYGIQYTLIQVDNDYLLESSASYSTEEPSYVPGARISPDESLNEVYHLFTCPCDGAAKWYKIDQNDGHYKYYHDESTWTQDQLVITDYNCPNENIIYESDEISRSVGKYSFIENKLDDITYWNGAFPERAIITIDNFGQFEYHAYEFVSKEEQGQDVCYYKDIEVCDSAAVKCTSEKIDAYGYIWEDSNIKMGSLEGNQDLYLLRDTDLRFRIRNDNGLREISLEYHSDDGNNYQPKIDVFKTVSYPSIDDNGFETTYKAKILVGSFYIIDDWNLNGAPPQQFIYEIDNGLENVDFLERMEYCRAKQTFAIDTDKNTRCNNYRYDQKYATTPLTVFYNPRTMYPYEPNADYYQTKDGQILEGNFAIIKQNDDYYKWTRAKAADYSSLGSRIIVDAEHFPGTYKIVGETYARSYIDGKDQRYQFEIPLCKLSASTNLTLEAAGDPTTFSMSFKVLRNESGEMMRLTQYSVSENAAGSTDIVSTEQVKTDELPEMAADYRIEERRGAYHLDEVPDSMRLMLHNPTNGTVVYIDSDSNAPNMNAEWGGLAAMTDTELSSIIDNWRVPQTGSTLEIPIYNESVKSTVNLETQYPTKVVVSQAISYDQSQEVYQVLIDLDGNEREIEGTRHLEPTGVSYTSIKFLSPNEYDFTAGAQEVGE